MANPDGYIITDKNGIIQGSGVTVDDAWKDVEHNLSVGRIALLSDDDSADHLDNNWMRRSDMEVLPSSAALLAQVAIAGCALVWHEVDGVAVTRDEWYDA